MGDMARAGGGKFFNASGRSGRGADWKLEWDFKGTVWLEVALAAIAVGSLFTLSFSGQSRGVGYVSRCAGFTSGLSFCLIHKARKKQLELVEVEKRIQAAELAWEEDKQHAIAQIESSEAAYLAEIERLTQLMQEMANQQQAAEDAIAQLQLRLTEDKKYLYRIWEFKQQNPGDANKLPKIIPAIFYDWKPGARLPGTPEYNQAKRYFIELDG